MLKYENRCRGCDGYPCIDCGRKAVETYYCDKCGEEIDKDNVYYDGEEELCKHCLLNKYRKEI